MIYASCCSGIEAASVAWKPLGWSPAWFSEIEPFCRALLEQRHPGVPNLGDMLAITEDALRAQGAIDVLVGGTPCQSFSVAGLRAGLGDPRGNLALRFLQLAGVLRPRWVVWENVPGVLSSGAGRDFGSIVGALAELGYGWSYRVVDAQYFGLAQRRARVFLVGHLGDWRPAAAVFLERSCLRGDSPPRREKGSEVTQSLTRGLGAGGADDNRAGFYIPDVSPAIKARDYKGSSSDGDGDGAPLIAHALRAEGHDASEDGTGRGTPIVPVGGIERSNQGAGGNRGFFGMDEAVVTLTRQMGESGIPAIAFAQNQRDEVRDLRGLAGALPAEPGMKQQTYLAQPITGVRRITPREAERLQGFPDDYTLVTYRGKPAADGPRYRALGNSMAVPCMRWIAERIELVQGVSCAVEAA